MSIVDEIEAKYRAMPLHGVQFSIEAEAYDCREKVVFGESKSAMQCGRLFNWQDVLLEGVKIGFLEEVENGKLFDPMTVSFYVPIDEDKVTEAMTKDPHYFEDEWCFMRFATLQQMVDYVRRRFS